MSALELGHHLTVMALMLAILLWQAFLSMVVLAYGREFLGIKSSLFPHGARQQR